MRSRLLILASLLFAACAFAQEANSYLTGELLEMNSVPCGVRERAADSAANAKAKPADAASSCQEYVLESDEVTYRIVSHKTKHSVLLPVGEDVRFRLQDGKMHLRTPDLNGKEREYSVLSVTPRGQSAADSHPIHLNHLQ